MSLKARKRPLTIAARNITDFNSPNEAADRATTTTRRIDKRFPAPLGLVRRAKMADSVGKCPRNSGKSRIGVKSQSP